MRELIWVGTSLDDLRQLPEEVRGEFGHGLHLAQLGMRHSHAKPYDGSIELVERHDGDTYRCIYNIKIDEDIYVLHAFQKKSTKGIGLPKHEKALIESRLKAAHKIAAERRLQA
jgi:phage-related protein